MAVTSDPGSPLATPMLTVASSRQPATDTPATWNARRTRSAAIDASSTVPGKTAANSSPPRRPRTSEARRLVLAVAPNTRSASSPTPWPKAVVDRLKAVEIEHHDGDRLAELSRKTRRRTTSKYPAQTLHV